MLRVASVLSALETSVDIILKFPSQKTTFTTQEAGKLSFSDGVIDFLMTRLPARCTCGWNHLIQQIDLNPSPAYLFQDLTTAFDESAGNQETRDVKRL